MQMNKGVQLRIIVVSVVFFTVIYVFDAQSGKPLGDGKPITHKV